MAKALYYDANLKGKPFEVLATNPDGTVNIGAGKLVAVKNCPVADKPKHGHVTLVENETEKENEDEGKKAEETAAKPEGRAKAAK